MDYFQEGIDLFKELSDEDDFHEVQLRRDITKL